MSLLLLLGGVSAGPAPEVDPVTVPAMRQWTAEARDTTFQARPRQTTYTAVERQTWTARARKTTWTAKDR